MFCIPPSGVPLQITTNTKDILRLFLRCSLIFWSLPRAAEWEVLVPPAVAMVTSSRELKNQFSSLTSLKRCLKTLLKNILKNENIYENPWLITLASKKRNWTRLTGEYTGGPFRFRDAERRGGCFSGLNERTTTRTTWESERHRERERDRETCALELELCGKIAHRGICERLELNLRPGLSPLGSSCGCPTYFVSGFRSNFYKGKQPWIFITVNLE